MSHLQVDCKNLQENVLRNNSMTAYWLAGATCVMTFGGGLIALRLEAYRGMVFSFCAGALVAGALLNVIPEALDLLEASQPQLPHHHLLFACGLGFLVFYLLEHAVHHDHQHKPNSVRDLRQRVGTWGALGIGIHSFFDGVAIGGAFQAGHEMGWVVALAVMIHKVADGASSVGVMLSTRHSVPQVVAVLSATAIAPLIGTIVQSAFVIPTPLLALILGWFSGVFLYLGASCLLPAAHETSRSRWLPLSTLAGAALIYVAHSLAE
jgi:zinc transporter, ZIP family